MAREYIEIGDFSPGIFADQHVGSIGLGTNGAAVLSGTYGCHADRSGALVPLPLGTPIADRAASTFSAPSATAPTFFPVDRVGTYLLDAVAVPGIYENITSRTKLFLMYGTIFDPAGTSTYRQLAFGVLAGLRDTDWTTIHWNRYDPGVTVESYDIMSGNAMMLRSIDGHRDADDFIMYGLLQTETVLCFMFHSSPNAFNDENLSWATGAIPANEQALTNYDTLISTNYPVSADSAASACIGTFPNPLGNNTDTYPTNGAEPFATRYVSTIPGYLAAAHQARLVVASHASRRFGKAGSTSIYALIDRLYYSPVYNPALVAATTSPATTFGPPEYQTSIAGDENVNAIGLMASLTASELLVIKHAGGGILLRGDMDNFEAVTLPFIEPTYGLRHHGVPTPIGLVYGSRNGVFAWQGGSDTSTHLSPQLTGFFWNHTSTPYIGNRGRFGWWNPYVAVPNNFIYDTVAKSWWRLDVPTSTYTAYNIYLTDPATGNLLAFPHMYTPGVTPKWLEYDETVLRPSYQWVSQPLVETRETLYSVHDIEITISTAAPFTGTHQITAIISGYDHLGATVASRTITFTPSITAGESMQVLQANVINATATEQGTFTARYLKLTLTAVAHGATTAAPKIHKVRIGVSERTKPPKIAGND